MADGKPASVVIALIGALASIAVAWITTATRFEKELEQRDSSLSELKTQVASVQTSLEKVGIGKLNQSVDGLRREVARLREAGILDRLPAGVILPWLIGDDIPIPAGWAICDGRNGTPDLRARFLRGASRAGVGQFGGEQEHQHKGQTGGEVDGAVAPKPPPDLLDNFGGRNWSHKHELSTAPAQHLPPFFDVVFIIRLPAG